MSGMSGMSDQLYYLQFDWTFFVSLFLKKMNNLSTPIETCHLSFSNKMLDICSITALAVFFVSVLINQTVGNFVYFSVGFPYILHDYTYENKD